MRFGRGGIMATFGSAGIKLDTRRLDAMARGLKTNTSNALARTARQVEATAKMNIIAKDIIDTGAMLNSVTTTQQSEGVYWVHDGVEYGVYHELGTHRISARPFMVPAVEAVGAQVEAIIAKELFE
jgi:HK97 gp10 family phage protein